MQLNASGKRENNHTSALIKAEVVLVIILKKGCAIFLVNVQEEEQKNYVQSDLNLTIVN